MRGAAAGGRADGREALAAIIFVATSGCGRPASRPECGRLDCAAEASSSSWQDNCGLRRKRWTCASHTPSSPGRTSPRPVRTRLTTAGRAGAGPGRGRTGAARGRGPRRARAPRAALGLPPLVDCRSPGCGGAARHDRAQRGLQGAAELPSFRQEEGRAQHRLPAATRPGPASGVLPLLLCTAASRRRQESAGIPDDPLRGRSRPSARPAVGRYRAGTRTTGRDEPEEAAARPAGDHHPAG